MYRSTPEILKVSSYTPFHFSFTVPLNKSNLFFRARFSNSKQNDGKTQGVSSGSNQLYDKLSWGTQICLKTMFSQKRSQPTQLLNKVENMNMVPDFSYQNLRQIVPEVLEL